MDLMDQFSDGTCREDAIYSSEYKDLIIEFRARGEEVLNTFQPACVQRVDARFSIVYVEANKISPIQNPSAYGAIPKLFGLLDTSSMEEIGVLRLRRQPYINLEGLGVLVGFIDTGIDYTNSLFKNADNTTRIKAIWDQTVQNGNPPNGLLYGQEYTEEMINDALQLENPLELVPSTDENGHGTFMAGIAAGNEDNAADFTGVAPLSNIVVVKLKQAKQVVREYYQVSPDVEAYQENDIMLAIRYLLLKGQELDRPMVICIGVGTNSGDHSGNLPISLLLDNVAISTGVGIVVAAGNEANLGHHYMGIAQQGRQDQVELKVGDNEYGFTIELWSRAPNNMSVGFISPFGEEIIGIPVRGGNEQEINFVFEETTIFVRYTIVEFYTGAEVIQMRFQRPTSGIWRIEVYNNTDFRGEYNMWLPMEHFISPETYFIRSDPNTTICEPGNTEIPITVSTYNHNTNSIFVNSSRGYTSIGYIKPTLAAPGVEVYGPLLEGRFGYRTGSSIAAAHAAGIAALLMEWGVVQEHYVEMNTIQIKNFLIKGARRSNISYPNREWGYGMLDIYSVFESLRYTL